MHNEEKTTKYIIAAVLAVILIGAAVVVGQSNLLQGRLGQFAPNGMPKLGLPSGYYSYGKKIVSPVTSPVPTVVLSKVVSKGGPSMVASAIVTAVASPVATVIASMQAYQLPILTSSILKQAAQLYYMKYPAKFILSAAQKRSLLNAFKLRQLSRKTLTK